MPRSVKKPPADEAPEVSEQAQEPSPLEESVITSADGYATAEGEWVTASEAIEMLAALKQPIPTEEAETLFDAMSDFDENEFAFQMFGAELFQKLYQNKQAWRHEFSLRIYPESDSDCTKFRVYLHPKTGLFPPIEDVITVSTPVAETQ